MIKEFKPALMFLAKFLAIYIIGNLLYGLFVEWYGPRPDPMTRIVTQQSSMVLNSIGYSTMTRDHSTEAKIMIKSNGIAVLNVYEGCNGINVMIIFIAFLFAFGGPGIGLAWFLPLGLFVIHLMNLLRISFLFYLSLNSSNHFYYYHKYLFTATLYLVVFALWAVWVIRFNEKQNSKAPT